MRDTPEFNPSEQVIAEELIDCYLNDPERSGYYILVAEADTAIAGYICYGPTPMTVSTWDMYWEAVDRERRGQGIGNALTLAAEAEIIKAKGKLVIIETSSKPLYAHTRRFHQNHGYEAIARITDFYAPGDDKIIMQKRFNEI